MWVILWRNFISNRYISEWTFVALDPFCGDAPHAVTKLLDIWNETFIFQPQLNTFDTILHAP